MSLREREPPVTVGISSHVPLLLAIMVSASVWIALYTDFFPVFGSILGLGGVLVVVPALHGLMKKSRQEAYARYFDDILFQSSWSARIYVAILAFIIVIGFGAYQPVRIHHPVTFPIITGNHKIGPNDVPFSLVADSTTSFPILQPFLGGPRKIQVSVSSLPTFTVQVEPFQWPRIVPVQQAWVEPVVILRPSAEGAAMLTQRQPRLLLTFRREGKKDLIACKINARWLGRPIWLGGGTGVIAPPDSLRQSWLAEDAVARRRAGNEGEGLGLVTAGYYQRPSCQDGVMVPDHLKAGDQIGYRLVNQAEELIVEGTYHVPNLEIYPAELIIGAD